MEDIFSQLCTICYNNKEPLKYISGIDGANFKNTLLSLVGHREIINTSIILLCRSCQNELLRIEEFKKKCMENFINLQKQFKRMKNKIELSNDVNISEKIQGLLYRNVSCKCSVEKTETEIELSQNTGISSGKPELNSMTNDINMNIKQEYQEVDYGEEHSNTIPAHGIFTTLVDSEATCQLQSNSDNENEDFNLELRILEHLPEVLPRGENNKIKRKRCRHCFSNGIRKETNYCCSKCSGNPGLCIGNCYKEYHKAIFSKFS